ncbi:MAG: dihydrolipoyl dehydrogenase [Bacillota bacterium]|jgi:dihydrolipoamide dehydrogenase
MTDAKTANGHDYDITVIGGGPGGYVAAIKAAQLGKKVCLVEEAVVGGTCLNFGCIPTKTLIKTVNLFSEIKSAEKFAIAGLDADGLQVCMSKLQERKQAVISRLVAGVSGLLVAGGVTFEQGHARFLDRYTIESSNKNITSDYFIIATGSSVFMPPFIDISEAENLMTSKQALSLEHVPASVIIIGGGVIGIEFAYILHKLGSRVTVVELMDTILPMVDAEISDLCKRNMTSHGVKFINGSAVRKIRGNTVIYSLNGEEQFLEAAAVLMAVGRVPNATGLNLEAIGMEMDEKAIKTDDSLRTNIDNIYAVGDVNGKVMLAHTASHEGLFAVANICGQAQKMQYEQIPSCIYIEPEVASIGLTEDQAREKYGDIRIGKFPMLANAKSLIAGDSSGMMKIVLSADDRILGAHLYCQNATDIIGELAVAMAAGAKADVVIKAVHPHPTFCEGIPEAFMSASFGRAIHAR